jgi:hypothetical protein
LKDFGFFLRIFGRLYFLYGEIISIARQGGASHFGLTIYIQKYLKAKEELWKLKYISPCKNR